MEVVRLQLAPTRAIFGIKLPLHQELVFDVSRFLTCRCMRIAIDCACQAASTQHLLSS